MNAKPQFLSDKASLDDDALASFPNSRKIYVDGKLFDIRVPMREITQSPTQSELGKTENPKIYVYDTSGPYTDPSAKVDIRKGLPELRKTWIEARNDTELLNGPTSIYGKKRASDPELASMRFDLARNPLRAKTGKNVSQMHYAKNGIVTPEMEFIAIRENLEREDYPCQYQSSRN
jgi:phosphomethylpyrimidine synthase